MANKPNSGPIIKRLKLAIGQMATKVLSNWMLKIVMKKPIEFTMVRAVPLASLGAVCAK